MSARPTSQPDRTRLVARSARDRLVDVSRKPAPAPAEHVIAAFGGKSLGRPFGDTAAPVTLLAIRDALTDRLRSTGGRPALAGDGARQRVQVSADDWRIITDIAGHVEVGRHRPSPAQVASVLIHLALERIPSADITQSMHTETED